MIKAILFDMDGVLIDSNNWHFEAFNKALNLIGFSISYEEHLNNYNGLTSKMKLEKLSKEKGLPKIYYDFIYENKQKYLIEIILNNIKVNFNIINLLKELRAKGLKLACCSNTISNSVNLILNKAGLFDYFDLILSSEDVINPKPSPEIYLLAIQKLSLKPEEIYILEDSTTGLIAAKKSGANYLKITSVEDININLFNKILI